MKQVFKENNLPTVDYVWFYDTEYYDQKEELFKKIGKMGYPVVVKPATLGSSIGITKVSNKEDLANAIEEAIKYDEKIIVEEAIDNLCELNCSVIGNYEYQEASAIEEVLGKDNILSYKDKYVGSSKVKGLKGAKGSKGMASTSRILPAKIDEKLENNIKDTAKEVFRVMGLSGVCRIDFLVDRKSKKFYVNEPNTIPGSLSFYLWEQSGKSYQELLDTMITTSIKEYKKKEKKVYTFDTNILSYGGGLKGAKKLKR